MMKTYQNAIVLGLGSSGLAAAELLAREGTEVSVLERADTPETRSRADKLKQLGVKTVLNRQSPTPGTYQLCVVSPGIAPDSEWPRYYKNRGAEIIGEMELGWSKANCKTLAVTGSNGKSTVCKLCADILARAGIKAYPCGNYGTPVSRAVLQPEIEWLVIEASSFQLETTCRFRPDIGVLLNIIPNHLDRHGTMEKYAGIKTRIFANMRRDDTAIFNENLSCLFKNSSLPDNVLVCGTGEQADFRYVKGRLECRADKTAFTLNLNATMFDNEILGTAAAAAVAATCSCGVNPDDCEQTLPEFKPLSHRMEFVLEKNGIRFVDDSKATNLAAAMAALRMCPGNIRLIAGGRPKGESFAKAVDLLEEKVKTVYLIGEASKAMADAWRDATPCNLCETMEIAMKKSWLEAAPGDTILLSPACASFDQFSSFEERGDTFQQLARKIAEQ